MTSATEGGQPVILFDAVCNLCTGSVRFVIERDSRKRFRFASLQSAVAERLLGERDQLESMVLVQGAKVYRKSTAALLIARRLDGLWPLLSVLLLIPRLRRDALYDWVKAALPVRKTRGLLETARRASRTLSREIANPRTSLFFREV